jgi:PAS domain S-box-containing protein
MSALHGSRRIFWMVRLLTAVGLTAIILLIGLVGHQLGSIHTERVKLLNEQERLYRMSEEILRRSTESRGEIIAILDETAIAGTSGAAAGLAEMVDHLLGSTDHPFAPGALKQLDALTGSLTEVERRAVAWRPHYDPVWQDVRQQRTMGQVRDLITGLRGAVETLAGRRRLQEAIQLKRWRAVNGEEAAHLAQAILAAQDGKQIRSVGDLERELAEVESLVELLGGEEQHDNLPDLKDNKLTPALERLNHDIVQLVEAQPDNGVLTTQAIERLTAALFGQGYTKDQADQTIRIGTGGLYQLRQNLLLLRDEHKKLSDARSTLSHEIDLVVEAFMLSARAQAESLAGQLEKNLASSWRRMILTGVCCSALFVWLAWLISRAIRVQVRVIERAKSEAEAGGQKAQLLMQNLRKLQRDHELVLNAIGEGIHWLDCDGRIIYENPAGARLLGWEGSELIGRPAHATMHHSRADGSNYPQGECPIYASLQAGISCRSDREVFWRKDRTSIPVEYVSTPVRDENDKIIGAVVVFADITERKRAQADLEKSHKELMEVSRRAGMAEVATGVLHNVGNVLNSVNVGSACVAESLRRSKAANLTKVVALLREHEADLGGFLTNDPKGKQLPGYLALLSDHLASEQADALKELAQLQKNIEHIKDIVTMQQSFAKLSGVTEIVNVSELVEDALKMNLSGLARHDIEVIKEFKDTPLLTVEKHKALQILVNLVRNAKHACDASDLHEKKLTIRTTNGEHRVRIAVSDNGVGILSENLTRIFSHGFTTKKDGHGFGLHSGALAAKEMGGSLTVQSDGPGQGATFTLELPLNQAGELT